MKTSILSFIVVIAISTGVTVQTFAGGAPEEPEVAPRSFDIISHEVHRRVAMGDTGGDIITPWADEHARVTEVSWTTMGIGEIHDRLFREAAASRTEIDLAYVLNPFVTPRVAGMLEPLNDMIEESPIAGFEDNFPAGMLDALSFDGDLYAIPVRSATHAFGWNERIFEERGLSGPPTTPEEFEEYARELTFTRDDGTQVFGFVNHANYYYTGFNSTARMFGGGLITPDFEVIVDSEGTIKALEMWRRFYEEGIMPPEVPTWAHAEKERAMVEGHAAMAFDVFARFHDLNEPDRGDWGYWRTAEYPVDPDAGIDVAAPNTEFWSLAIPRNAADKEASWDFIRHLSSHDSAVAMALNGNGPARLSVFTESTFQEQVENWQLLESLEADAQPPLPGFEEASEATELIDEYIERGMLGDMDPGDAMRELADELRALSDVLW